MNIKIVKESITREELKNIAKEQFGDLVKAVVDLDKEIIAIAGELHADEEALLIKGGSKSESLWGINFYPERLGDEFIEFDSMINLKPSLGNRSRGISNPEVKEKIKKIVDKLIRD